MERLERETADNDRLALWIAFDYGGRAELVEAARRLHRGRASPPSDVDEDALAARLYAPGAARPRPPDPDVRRAADLELPALAARVRRARVHRHALAGLRRATTCAQALDEYAARRPARSAADEQLRLAHPRRGRRLLPLVLGVVWLGGWWLFGLALVAGLIALHELYAMARGAAAARARRATSARSLTLLGAAARRPDLDARRRPRHARARVRALRVRGRAQPATAAVSHDAAGRRLGRRSGSRT